MKWKTTLPPVGERILFKIPLGSEEEVEIGYCNSNMEILYDSCFYAGLHIKDVTGWILFEEVLENIK